MISNYFEAIEDESNIPFPNSTMKLCVPKNWKRDPQHAHKAQGIRQCQYIHELYTYITDVHGISYDTLVVCHMCKKRFGEKGGRTLDCTIGGENHIRGRHFLRKEGVPTLEEKCFRYLREFWIRLYQCFFFIIKMLRSFGNLSELKKTFCWWNLSKNQ